MLQSVIIQNMEVLKQHAIACYPEEACGVVVNFKYIPCKNIHDTPLTNFRIDPLEYFKAEQINTIQAIIHNHPITGPIKYNAYYPSGTDMINWMKSDVPWGIYSTEGENVSNIVWLDHNKTDELIGREFIHGIHDCYSLCRDYYKSQGIIIPNYARDITWWKKGIDLYSDNFNNAGFHEIPLKDVKYGDAFLIQYGARVINHAAIYYDENKILDHSHNRLSQITTLSNYAPYIKKAVRHNSKKEI